MKKLKRKKLPQKKIKLTLSLILKRQLMLVSYIFYPRYIRGSVTCLDALLFQTVVSRQKKFRNT